MGSRGHRSEEMDGIEGFARQRREPDIDYVSAAYYEEEPLPLVRRSNYSAYPAAPGDAHDTPQMRLVPMPTLGRIVEQTNAHEPRYATTDQSHDSETDMSMEY